MSVRSCASSHRFGTFGSLAVGVIGITFVTLQGCGPSIVNASSAREPGAPIAGLGALGTDPPARVSERQPPERSTPERA